MVEISVIIPAYNAIDYLDGALDSIINQSFKDLEIICVDDGSTDTTLERLEYYASKDSRVQVYTQENQGPGGASNTGLSKAKGKYVSFVDSDDNIDQAFLSTLYETAQKNNADVVKGVMEIHHQDGKIAQTAMNKNINNLITQKSFIGIAWNHEFTTAIYKRSFLTKNKICFPLLTNGEDIIFILRTLQNKPSMIIENKALYFYLIRNNSATFTTNFSKFLNLIKFYEEQLDILQKMFLSTKEYQEFCQKNIISSIIDYFWNLVRKSSLSEEEINILKQKINDIINKIPQISKIFILYKKYYEARFDVLNDIFYDSVKQYLLSVIKRNDNVPVQKNNIKITLKLFNFLPMFNYKRVGSRKQWKIFGLPIFKTRHMANGITSKYYVFGIPILKVSKKAG